MKYLTIMLTVGVTAGDPLEIQVKNGEVIDGKVMDDPSFTMRQTRGGFIAVASGPTAPVKKEFVMSNPIEIFEDIITIQNNPFSDTDSLLNMDTNTPKVGDTGILDTSSDMDTLQDYNSDLPSIILAMDTQTSECPDIPDLIGPDILKP